MLDGFDFGAGVMHLFVAKTDEEGRTVLATVGPVWDGNDVWLIGAAGVLVFAFPRAYAAAFSGLYLPMTMVLWLLILRGIAIEFRSQFHHTLWRAFFDFVFATSSAIMAVVLGVALGNVLRGVPLEKDGWFVKPLFSNFSFSVQPGERLGALDTYTGLVGLFSLATLSAHGLLFSPGKPTGWSMYAPATSRFDFGQPRSPWAPCVRCRLRWPTRSTSPPFARGRGSGLSRCSRSWPAAAQWSPCAGVGSSARSSCRANLSGVSSLPWPARSSPSSCARRTTTRSPSTRIRARAPRTCWGSAS